MTPTRAHPRLLIVVSFFLSGSIPNSVKLNEADRPAEKVLGKESSM
jgi:hypothetical protein